MWQGGTLGTVGEVGCWAWRDAWRDELLPGASVFTGSAMYTSTSTPAHSQAAGVGWTALCGVLAMKNGRNKMGCWLCPQKM